jgi:hypothetical protein
MACTHRLVIAHANCGGIAGTIRVAVPEDCLECLT